jgi:hypothetical protein
MQVEKTHFIEVEGKMYSVSSLPKQLQDQVARLDFMRQDQLEASIRFEAANFAVGVAELQIKKIIHLMNNQPEAEAETKADNG